MKGRGGILIAGALILALIVGVLVLRGRAPTEAPAEKGRTPTSAATGAAPAERALAPDFTRTSLDGDPVSVAQFRGRSAVVVNSWAIWCPFCVDELPDFAAVSREFPAVTILAVNRGESVADQRRYLAQVKGENLLESPLVFVSDPGDAVYQLLGGYGMPVTVFITRDGAVASVKSGPLTREEMRARMQQLLATS